MREDVKLPKSYSGGSDDNIPQAIFVINEGIIAHWYIGFSNLNGE
jgi:hypothetical protein